MTSLRDPTDGRTALDKLNRYIRMAQGGYVKVHADDLAFIRDNGVQISAPTPKPETPTRAREIDPLQVAGGWQVVEPNAFAGFHHAEGPGDLRICTNDRALLDRILAQLQSANLGDAPHTERLSEQDLDVVFGSVGEFAYNHLARGYAVTLTVREVGRLIAAAKADQERARGTAAKCGVDLGGNPLPDIELNQLLADISIELRHARAKFPADDNLTTIAMLEEAGEVAKAVLSEDAAAVRKECIQLAVMAMRIILDGDRSTDAYRAKHHGLPPIA